MFNKDIELLKYILKHRKSDNTFTFQYDFHKTIKYSQDQLIRSLNNLMLMEYITYELTSKHKNDFSLGGKVTLLKDGLLYRTTKRMNFFNATIEVIKFLIPTLIALGALVVSYLAYRNSLALP